MVGRNPKLTTHSSFITKFFTLHLLRNTTLPLRRTPRPDLPVVLSGMGLDRLFVLLTRTPVRIQRVQEKMKEFYYYLLLLDMACEKISNDLRFRIISKHKPIRSK